MSIATKCTCGSAINGVCNFSNGCPQLVPPPGRPKGGMPPLAEPALNDEDVNDWEMMKRKEGLKISDYEEVLADHRRLVRELDIIINGDNAATQAALGDVVRQIRDLWPKRQTGPRWVKASNYDVSKGGMLFYRFDGPTMKSIGIGHFVCDMFHGVHLDVFPKWDWKYLYILDEQPAAGREEDAVAFAEELWDNHSVLIGEDIFTLEQYANREVMKKDDFMKAIAAFKQHNP